MDIKPKIAKLREAESRTVVGGCQGLETRASGKMAAEGYKVVAMRDRRALDIYLPHSRATVLYYVLKACREDSS